MKEEVMTLEQYRAVKEGLQKAEEESTKPYIVQQEDELAVARDATQTQLEKEDYTVHLTIPIYEIEEKGELLADATVVQENSHSIKLKKTFKGRFISPRMQTKMGMSALQILPFFKPFMEDGKITDVSDEQANDLLIRYGTKLVDSIYEVVSIFLDIPDLVDGLDWGDAIDTFIKMANHHPEFFNEVDSFTNKQS